jgi:hypothetical protein
VCFGRRGLGPTGPVKVPELVPRRDIFERQLRASPPGFTAIYEIGIPYGLWNLFFFEKLESRLPDTLRGPR